MDDNVRKAAVFLLAIPILVVLVLGGVTIAGESIFPSDNEPATTAEKVILSAALAWLVLQAAAGILLLMKSPLALWFAYPALAWNLAGFPFLTILSIWGFVLLVPAQKAGYFRKPPADTPEGAE